MFNSGEAVLIEPSRTILRFIADLLDERIASVVVEGHTDDRPIHTARFPSNWELSAGRAASVVRFMLSLNDVPPPDRYVAIGYGEYRPLESNTTAAGRARNRRVEIFFSWTPWQNPIQKELEPAQPKERLPAP